MTSEAAIQTHQLSMRFGKHVALAPLDLTIPRGSVYALAGHNGAGKTTLLKVLLNILRPTAGTATILDTPTSQLDSSIFTRVGYVAEGQEMPEWMTVRGFMDYLQPFYPTWDEGTLLRDLDLPEDRRIRDLSRGMRMKLALASVLAFRPELILMDEPFSGLDPLVRDELTRTLIDRLAADDGTPPTVLISTHDLTEIEPFATHAAMLHKGHLLFAEPLDNLLDRFREVTVTLSEGAQAARAYPRDWLCPESSGAVVRFVHPHGSSASLQDEVRTALPSTQTIEATSIGLREIFLALTRTQRSAA
jgi:ABC-2 type transport system ATP-binding protein